MCPQDGMAAGICINMGRTTRSRNTNGFCITGITRTSVFFFIISKRLLRKLKFTNWQSYRSHRLLQTLSDSLGRWGSLNCLLFKHLHLICLLWCCKIFHLMHNIVKKMFWIPSISRIPNRLQTESSLLTFTNFQCHHNTFHKWKLMQLNLGSQSHIADGPVLNFARKDNNFWKQNSPPGLMLIWDRGFKLQSLVYFQQSQEK